jgi:hypothetical protein
VVIHNNLIVFCLVLKQHHCWKNSSGGPIGLEDEERKMTRS